MARVRVAVLQGDDGGFIVEPPLAFLGKGDKLVLINTTRETLVLKLPDEDPIPIGPGKKWDKLAKKTDPVFEKFSYRITRGRFRAKGNSDPVIIIENP